MANSGTFPIAHDAGGNMDSATTTAWMQDILKLPATKIFHNASYDVGWLLVNGFELKENCRHYDCCSFDYEIDLVLV